MYSIVWKILGKILRGQFTIGIFVGIVIQINRYLHKKGHRRYMYKKLNAEADLADYTS